MNYKLYHGDCLEKMDYLIQEDIKVDAIITDPPYGTTADKKDLTIDFNKMWQRLNLLSNPNTPIIIFGCEPFSSHLRISNIKNYKYDWIWIKNKSTNFLNAKKQPLRKSEFIHVFYKNQCLYNPQKTTGHKPVNSFVKHTSDGNTLGRTKTGISGGGQTDRYPNNILNFPVINNDNSGKNKFHQNQKPIKLMEYLIKTYSNENDLILDFTSGSNSTGIACQNTNRSFIGIEKDDKYFEIGKNRMDENNLTIVFQ